MHVLKLSDVYFPRINGVSTSIETFRQALAEHQVRVTVVAPNYPGGLEAEGVIRLPSRRVPLDPEDRLMHRAALHRLPVQLADAGIDLVHVQTPFAAHYAGLRLAKSLSVPCVATYHTHFEEYLSHYIRFLPRAALRNVARRLARSQCNALDAVVVPSTPMAETLREYGVTTPMHVIPTGLDDAQFTPGDGRRFRHVHAIGPERKIALFVGRAAFEKNIGFLLEVAAIARRSRPDLLLVVAGEGPALAALQRQAAQLGLADHVRFVGYLPRATGLKDCYAAADLFVFASLTETQGLVLLEAMALGVPVLAIPALGAAEIVRPERGAIAAPRDVAAFAAELVSLLDNPTVLAAIGAAGIGFAREWDAGGQAAKLATVYRSLLSSKRKHAS